MGSTAVIGLVAAALAVLAVIGVVTARYSDLHHGVGTLSREERARDADHRRRRSNLPRAGVAVERTARTRTSAAVQVAAPTLPAPFSPPEADTTGFTRRQFFNRSAVTLMAVGFAGFGAASLAFLWPRLSGGFGTKINAGNLDELKATIRDNKNAFYLAEARGWIVQYPAVAVPKAQAVYKGAVLVGMEAGVVALYQRCPHLGCRVPFCASSQWFECPCHGSQYNRVGEKKGGPAPRGMDRFGVAIKSGNLIVDTGNISLGPPIGTNTTGQEAEGPHCITSAGGHA
jgi:cytochrome b6-f complex iron-sulfur subunit